MRIGIDISQIVFEGTGVATYTRNLVTNLVRQGKNHEFVLFGASLRRKKLLDDFARSLPMDAKIKTAFFLLPPLFLENIWNQIHHVKVEKLIGKIDLFHSSDWTQSPTKAKKVTTVHDMIVYRYPEFSHATTEFRTDSLSVSPNIVATQKRRLAWVKKEADLILADSEATSKDIIKYLGIPKEKIKVIYLAAGLDYEEFAKSSRTFRDAEINRVRQKYNLTNRYLLAIGTREPRKNLARLVTAFNSLSLTDIDLVIAGKYGWGGEHKDLGIPQIRMPGFVSQTDLIPLLAGAYAFVYPSLYEGFGVPILEAFTLSCPVITSNLSSMPEVGGKAALYVNPESVKDISGCIQRLLSLRPAAYAALAKVSKAQSTNFSWEKTASETLQAYEALF